MIKILDRYKVRRIYPTKHIGAQSCAYYTSIVDYNLIWFTCNLVCPARIYLFFGPCSKNNI